MSKLIDKILSEAKLIPIIIYRMEYKNTHGGPFSLKGIYRLFNNEEAGMLDDILERYTKKFQGLDYKLPNRHSYVFGYTSPNDFKKYLSITDLKTLFKLGFKIKKYKTKDYIILNEGKEIAFDIKTAKLISE